MYLRYRSSTSRPLCHCSRNSRRAVVADTSSGRIRGGRPDGTIRTLVGNGPLGYSGDGGPPTVAQLDYPYEDACKLEGEILNKIGDGLCCPK